MANQVVTAYFKNTVPSGMAWELSDDSGVQSSGVLARNVDRLGMNVTVGLPIDHQYKLTFKNSDGVIYTAAQLNYSDGGIVIIENLDINEGGIKATATNSSIKTIGGK